MKSKYHPYGVEKNTTIPYKIIQSLIKKGYLHETTEVEKKDRDKRIRTYTLTSEGTKKVIRIITRMRKVIGFMESCCPDGNGIIIAKKAGLDDSKSFEKET